MSTIPINQARGLFTQQLIDVYKQLPEVKDFLGQFFPDKVVDTRYIYWAVRREGEPKAINVLRGTEGNRNTFSIETDKIVDPPYYREYFDITNTDLYYRAFSSALVDESIMADYLTWVAEHVQSMHNKIKRDIEFQRASILQTGIITLGDGTTIDFKRQGSSIVDLGSGAYWDTNATTAIPTNAIQAGCEFLRTAGKAQGGNFNCIMGESAMEAFLQTTNVKERSRDFYMKLSDLEMPLRDGNGAAYHGRISAGSYTVDLWTYPEYYDGSGGPVGYSTPYIASTNMILIPEKPRFITGYAAVPFLPKQGTSGMELGMPVLKSGKAVIGDYMDQRAKAWFVDVSSAGVALPTAIDQIYTAKVTAA